MAASLTAPVIDAAPGNQLIIAGSGLVPGGGASVTLSNQGVSATPNLTPSTITLSAVFDSTGNFVTVSIPDGVMDGTLTVTAGDSTVATCALRAVSQYIQASEYIGEGEPTNMLAPGELDALIRRASAMCDSFMSTSIRQLQVKEEHRYKDRPNGAPLLFPYRTRGRRIPIVSVDQLTFVSASDLVTVFNDTDLYVNQDTNYVEILAYAIGNYALLGELQLIGYSANVLELSYTSGYSWLKYPESVRTATIMATTMLLNRRRRQSMGLGPFSEYGLAADARLKLDATAVVLPPDARLLLAPFCGSTLA